MLKYKKSFFRLSLTTLLFLIIFVSSYAYRNNMIYNNLDANLKQKEIKYGNDINLKSLITGVNGKYKIVTDIDTKKLGNQEVLVKVKKENVSKIIPLNVKVVDKTKPTINIKKSNITINNGVNYDLEKNINSVIDDEEKLNYKEKVSEDSKEYFTIDSDFDKNKAGSYKVLVKAVDRAGNKTFETYTINVKEKVVNEVNNYTNNGNNNTSVNGNVGKNVPANVNGGGMVGLAYSLIGSRYVSGGSSPAGFDCSGFVAYVYSRFGKHITRSSSAQAHVGVGVSYANAKPGDILSWGHGGRVTHSALYVGNGTMIHATNPSQGVVASNIAAWERGSIDKLMYVRRVN